MVKLDYLEVKIVNHCNFKCRACSACANIAKKSEYDIDEFENDIKRISELLQISVFRLIGGEPLLSDKINAFLTISRRYLPDADIRIVTNGSLLNNMNQSFYHVLKDLSIKVDISYYIGKAENVKNKVKEGIKKLHDNKIPYEINKRKYFYLTMDGDNSNKDYDVIYKNCRERIQCNNLFHGKIYPCIQSCSFYQYDENFKTTYFLEEDGIDIYKPTITGENILFRLEHPIKFCRHCAIFPSYFTWQEGKAMPSDWMMDLNNELYNKQVSYYEYLDNDERTEINLAKVNINNEIKFIVQDSNNFMKEENFIEKPIYVWLDSYNCYYNFTQIVSRVLLENNIIYKGIISNNFVQSLNLNEKIIDDKDVLFPCYIIFFPPEGRPFIQSLRKIKKQLSQLKR